MPVRQETNKDGFVCYYKKQPNGTETLLQRYQIVIEDLCPLQPAKIPCPGCMRAMTVETEDKIEGSKVVNVPKHFGKGNNALKYTCPNSCIYEYTRKGESESRIDRFSMFVNFSGKPNDYSPRSNVVSEWESGKKAIKAYADAQAIEFGLDEGVTPEEEKKIAKMPMKRKTTEKIEEEEGTIDVSQDTLRKKFLRRHDSDEIYTQRPEEDDDFIEEVLEEEDIYSKAERLGMDVIESNPARLVPKTPVSTMVPKKMFKPSTTTSNYSKKK